MAPTVPVGQPLVIQPHAMQDGRVQIMDMHAVFHGRQPELIGCAVADASLHTTARHEDGEPVMIMVASLFTFRSGGAAELTTPDHEGFIKQTSRLEIPNQSRYSLVTRHGQLGMPADTARTSVVHTLLGAARLLEASDEEPAALRAKVTSPGGTTAAAIAVLDSSGVQTIVRGALEAARDRSRELAGA